MGGEFGIGFLFMELFLKTLHTTHSSYRRRRRRRRFKGELALKSVLMHHPVGLLAFWSSAFVEHQGLLHANKYTAMEYLFIFPSGLPVAGIGRAVRPESRGVLAILHAEEVPFFLPHAGLPYKHQNIQIVRVSLGLMEKEDNDKANDD